MRTISTRRRKTVADIVAQGTKRRARRTRAAAIKTRKPRARVSKQETTKPTTNYCHLQLPTSIENMVTHLTSIPKEDICSKYIDACKQQGADSFLSTKFAIKGDKVVRLNESAVSLFLSWLQDEIKKSPRKRIYKKMWNLKAPELCQLARMFMVKLAYHASR